MAEQHKPLFRRQHKPSSSPSAGKLSIGALARTTGIPVETLRTWERRYGFPEPERKPSGHRVYPLSSVPRLRQIAEALARGHRASDAVSASEDALQALLEIGPPRRAASLGAGQAETGPPHPELLAAVAKFDADQLTRALLSAWARLGPLDFLRNCVAPVVHAVGEEWAAGRLQIHHEHFMSEKVGDVLRSLRLPFEERAEGPLIVCATLPGEAHGLGLQMAALLLATLGCRLRFLGTEVPVAQIAELAQTHQARAVAISVSLATREPRSARQIRRLRQLLPRRLVLLVGGEGAPVPSPGVDVIRNLGTLDAWGRRLSTVG